MSLCYILALVSSLYIKISYRISLYHDLFP